MLDKIDRDVKLKYMFYFVMIVEIPLGLFMLILPDVFINLLGFPPQDFLMYGVAASIWLAFGLVSILGIREPMKYVPILLFQFTYKCIWFIGVVIPAVTIEQIPISGIFMIVTFAIFITCDIIVIPWDTIIKKE